MTPEPRCDVCNQPIAAKPCSLYHASKRFTLAMEDLGTQITAAFRKATKGLR